MSKVKRKLWGALVIAGLCFACVFTGCKGTSSADDEGFTVSQVSLDGCFDAPACPGVAIPVSFDTAQYTGAVSWKTGDGKDWDYNTFAPDTVYEASITLLAKSGWTFDGLFANSFTLQGAKVASTAGSGPVQIVTAVFPATAAAGAYTRPLICFGDSLTAGYNEAKRADERETSYPADLADALTIPVVNAGVSGEESGDGLERIRAGSITNENPQAVIVEFGANDFFHGLVNALLDSKNGGDKMDVDTVMGDIITATASNLRDIIEAIREGGCMNIYVAKFYTQAVVADMLGHADTYLAGLASMSGYTFSPAMIASVYPTVIAKLEDSNFQSSLITKYDAMFASLESDKVTLIPDIWTGVWGGYDAAHNTPGGLMSGYIHPNAEGYAYQAEHYYLPVLSAWSKS
jgi:lysophospholipase L1-like esterase